MERPHECIFLMSWLQSHQEEKERPQHYWSARHCRVPGQRGGNMTICAAISSYGVIHRHGTLGPTNPAHLIMFLYALQEALLRREQRGDETGRASMYIYNTFTFMHLADAFIQSDLQLHSGYTFSFISICVPWESNPQPFARANAMLLPLSHTGTCMCNLGQCELSPVVLEFVSGFENNPRFIMCASHHTRPSLIPLNIFFLHGGGRPMTEILMHREISFSQWMQHVDNIGSGSDSRLDRHAKGFFPRCLARDRIACDVDEVLWPDHAQRHDAEADDSKTLLAIDLLHILFVTTFMCAGLCKYS